MDNAYLAVIEAENIVKKIRKAVKAKTLPRKRIPDLIELALEKGVITAEEKTQLATSEELRLDYIQVDDFNQEEYLSRS